MRPSTARRERRGRYVTPSRGVRVMVRVRARVRVKVRVRVGVRVGVRGRR